MTGSRRPPLVKPLLATFLVATCSGPGSAPPDLPPNPPGCEILVKEHRSKPASAVDIPARPLGVLMPPSRGYRNYRLEITLIVDEAGRPIPGTVEVSGARSVSDERELKELTLEWRFQPARVGECRVPALYAYTISGIQVDRFLGS